MIPLVPVDSSNVAAIGYDPETKDLFVKFKSGITYLYKKVPAVLHEGLMTVASKGQFLNAAIKDKFEYEKVAA